MRKLAGGFMKTGRFGATYRDVETLFHFGTFGHLSDGQLLERFLDHHDGAEQAFEALMARHGSMVLGVCHRVLGSSEGADDAFQATFLILVKRADSIRKKESLGPWLHGVARRVSLRAKRDMSRRRDRERIGFRVVGGNAPDEQLAQTLHSEIARLPEKYRTPIVLCDLEGQTHAEAAERLAWPIGTVSGRLSRARALLRTRIARRGVALSVGGMALTVGRTSKSAVASPLRAVTKAAALETLRSGRLAGAAGRLAEGVLTLSTRSYLSAAAGLFVSLGVGWSALVSGAGEVSTTRVDAVVAEAPLPVPPAGGTVGEFARKPTMVSALKQLDEQRSIISVALAPDGKTLASGSLDATITIWDLRTGLEKRTFLGHRSAVVSVAFTRDGHMLASRSQDCTWKLWEVSSGVETLSVTMAELPAASPLDLVPESRDKGRGGLGRDRCADGPVRDARTSLRKG